MSCSSTGCGRAFVSSGSCFMHKPVLTPRVARAAAHIEPNPVATFIDPHARCSYSECGESVLLTKACSDEATMGGPLQRRLFISSAIKLNCQYGVS
jgi:hypothetical protein